MSFALAVFAAPETNRIYFDEHIYQHIGQNLCDLPRAQMLRGQTATARSPSEGFYELVDRLFDRPRWRDTVR